MMRDRLENAAVHFSACPAIQTPESVCTFAQYRASVHASATRLRECGVQPGEVVALHLPHGTVDSLILLLAIIQARAIACPLDHSLPPTILAYRLNQVDARWIITDGVPVNPNITTLSRKRIVCHDGTWADVPEMNDDTPAVIIFTSGSSATPKAAVLSYGNLVYSAEAANRNLVIQPGDGWLLSLPLHHVSGLGVLFRCLVGGASVILAPWNAIPESGVVSHLSMVPMQLHGYLEEKSRLQILQKMKGILLGGGAFSPALIERAIAHDIQLVMSYGMTEMASQVTTTRPGDPPDTLKTAGFPLEPDTVALSARNEIRVRGKRLFLGYYDSGTLIRPFTEDGWFQTRDTGFFDDAGRLTLTGRLDNMFVCGGENIQPEAIEHALMQVDGMENACVVAIPDTVLGRVAVAFVRFRAEIIQAPASVQAILAAQLPAHHVPRYILPWPDDMPSEGIKPPRHQLAIRAEQLVNAKRYE